MVLQNATEFPVFSWLKSAFLFVANADLCFLWLSVFWILKQLLSTEWCFLYSMLCTEFYFSSWKYLHDNLILWKGGYFAEVLIAFIFQYQFALSWSVKSNVFFSKQKLLKYTKYSWTWWAEKSLLLQSFAVWWPKTMNFINTSAKWSIFEAWNTSDIILKQQNISSWADILQLSNNICNWLEQGCM